MISGGDVGGAKTHVLSLLDGLNKTEDVHLICFTEGEFAQEARRLGIPTTVLCDGSLFSVRRRILAMIRHDGYQVIHCHGARANMIGMLLRRKANVPLISTVHSDYRLDYLGRRLAALTSGNITHSPTVTQVDEVQPDMRISNTPMPIAMPMAYKTSPINPLIAVP